MIRNYLKIALRNLLRNSTYSIINLAGLSVGLASSILIGLWVMDELSFDSFHVNRNRLQYVMHFKTIDGHIETNGGTPILIQEEFRKLPTLFKNTTVSDDGGIHLLTADSQRLKKKGQYVGPGFLEMFQFELLKGSSSSVLTDPHSIVLTESIAKLLFGTADPMNKVMRIDNRDDVKVTGVLKDIPSNSSIVFDYLMPFELLRSSTDWVQECSQDWSCDWLVVYAELQPEADLAEVNLRIKNLLNEKTGKNIDELFLYPMTRWQLYGELRDGHEVSGRSDYVYGFTALAIFIIVVACINFTNLSTARSERRAREVGIRKISGSQRSQLILQFLGESIILVSVSFMISILLVELALPYFNILVHKQLRIDFASPFFWLSAAWLIVLVGMLAGSYPAFYLSSINPAKVLKGTVHLASGSNLPRRILVVFQFSFSVVVIIGSVVVYEQIKFTQNRNLGYDNRNILSMPDNPELEKNYLAFKLDLLQSGAVSAVTKSNAPITELFEMNYMEVPGVGRVEIVNIFSDYDFTHTMGIKMLEGRDFMEGSPSDSGKVLLNQAAIDLLGFDDPVGKIATIAETPMEIIGVIDNVLQGDPFEKILPTYIALINKWTDQHGPYVSVRLNDGPNAIDQVRKIEELFKKYSPAYPFEYSFADEDFGKRFAEISMLFRITNLFSFLTIFIACLGLLGLATFTVERRTKELGVRKVLGADVPGLMMLISMDFLKLVLISILLAGPPAFWFFSGFLERYPYHIEMSWWIVVATGGMTLLMALAVVSTQTYRAGLVNPVESLKHE